MTKLSLKDRILRRLGLYDSGEAAENWHEDFILHLAKIIRPQIYVELGLYQCTVFNSVSRLTEIAIGVDLNPDTGKYMRNSPGNHFICKTSAGALDEIKSILQSREIDMIFIDADHSYEAVLSDFNSYFPLINENGIILIHDAYPKSEQMLSNDYCGDGFRAIYELSLQRELFEVVTIPRHPGLAICRKRSRQLAWL